MSKIEKTKKNILDAINHVVPEKVPVIFSTTSGVPMRYAGVDYDEIALDPAAVCDAFCKIFDVLPTDAMITTNTENAPYKGLQTMELMTFIISRDHTTVVHDQTNQPFFGEDVYDEIIADAGKFITKTYPEFKFPYLKEKSREEVYGIVKEAVKTGELMYQADQAIADRLREQYGIYGIDDEMPLYCYSPLDTIFDHIRGIRGTLLDMRKRPDKLAAACDALWEYGKDARAYDPADMAEPLPVAGTTFHAECFISPKQFERFTLKYLIDGLTPALNAGKKAYVLGEGSIAHVLDLLADTFPKHSLIVNLDTDDSFEMKKKYGEKLAFITGMDMAILQQGTKEQCLDYVKRVFNELAPGGGFVFSTNQMMVSGKDVNLENLIAIYQEADRLSRK